MGEIEEVWSNHLITFELRREYWSSLFPAYGQLGIILLPLILSVGSPPLILNLNSCSLFCLVVGGGGTLFLDCFPHSRSISPSLSPLIAVSHHTDTDFFCDPGRNRNGASINDVTRTEWGRGLPLDKTHQVCYKKGRSTLRTSYMMALWTVDRLC